MEARWLRSLGPGIVSVGLLTALASTAGAAQDRPWDPPDCDGGPLSRIVAARDPGAMGPGPAGPWFRIEPILDEAGSLTGQRLMVGAEANAPAEGVELPAESFAAGPFGRIILVGTDDGRRSTLRALDVVDGCAWSLADEDAVIRRATLSPDGVTVYETRVERTSRADLGVWGRPTDGRAVARRALAPLPADERFGRTWSTEFAWSVDGDRLAVQGCGALACRTRVLDPATGEARSIADPALGPIVGLTADRVVSHRACRGFPCGLVSTDPETGRSIELSDAAGPAVIAGHGATARVVHERLAGLAGHRLRSVGVRGEAARDLGPVPVGLGLRPDATDAWTRRRLADGWVLLAGEPAVRDGSAGPRPLLRRADDGTTLPADEVSR